MNISTIKGLQRYIKRYSNFSGRTINSVIFALGVHPSRGTLDDLKELAAQFENCAEHGADIGISGFIYYHETIAFFKKHRQDIVAHMEQTAAELGTDIISMVQGFGVFRNSDKPGPSEVGRALWGGKKQEELTTLYNVFAWYALEEVSRTWYRYLEEHPAVKVELSA
jgi:hypothetical protein